MLPITEISVTGFKSIRDLTNVAIRPLTLLAGANSSGKSSAMQPLLLVKQTLEASFDPGALLLDGPNVRFTSVEQALSRLSGSRGSAQFAVELTLMGGHQLRLAFGREPDGGVSVREMLFRSIGETIRLRPGMTHDEVVASMSDGELREVFGTLQEIVRKRLKGFRWATQRDRCFLNVAPSGGTAQEQAMVQAVLTSLSFGLPPFSLGRLFLPAIKGIIHVPGSRGNPARTYGTTAVGPDFPGLFQDYVASVITQWQASESVLLRRLNRRLQKLGLTSRVTPRPINGTQVELCVARLPRGRGKGARDLVSIADVGFGVSQVLPVVVSLLAARPGQLVYLEQPELHLHPRAQAALAELLAEAARRGVRVVAETHSSLLLLAVQTLVAEGKLAADLVKLHWFERSANGCTRVRSADLDEGGSFGDWPEDFGDVELQAESRYLDAAERARGGK